MKLANQDQVAALDPTFGRMAAEVGVHAWSLPQLTMREKAFVFLAADLCTVNLGFPLLTHVQMAEANGVSVAECVAAIRHLAPYAGYPTAAVALQQVSSRGEAKESQPVHDWDLPTETLAALADLDDEFASFVANQYHQRWGSGELSPRERALVCIAVDVLNQTLDESFSLHIDLAYAAGAGDEQVRAVLLLVAEYGIAKAWRAFRALAAR
ncbi:alkylhydroperoxidase/carboxymuconolactone decarboxylase family protein YurZ [Mycobacterium sp. OAS707]|uniref:carboxymuconolactone decarboxylase family protein n=1 Tax=Mycobacterium sp. OAS707 TaxID=2663822 RepID=UPI0019F65508|nr:alkylhydroperoxidase/carboxymuconolactone decarboxylase family protein YurZ [Mycobacterium sp. OAS707]